ncbi:MAG: response regulator [Gammaproteobacteria bacterium]|nr:response regulator [Gammaproteobacteria bacterium]MBU1655778.1 response regulator [Gammaproteobacteria bacterium]MBU1961132.1 response regulator [Gammaproteobacteria bacterium]
MRIPESLKPLIFRATGLKTLALLLGILPALAIGLGLSGFFLLIHLNDLEDFFALRGNAVAHVLAGLSGNDLATRNVPALKSQSAIFLAQPGIERLIYRDASGVVILDQARPSPHIMSHEPLSFIAPVYAAQPGHSSAKPEGILLGKVEAVLCNQDLIDEKKQVITLSLAVMLGGLLLAALLIQRLSQGAVQPLLRLIDAIGEIKAGRLEVRVPCTSAGEFRILEEGFNEMASLLAMHQEQLEAEIAQATAEYRETLDALEERNIELYWARKEADRASAAKSEFLANMSHEIRTPLHGIIGFANQLLKSPLNEEQQEYLRTIISSSRTLQTIINDILNLSKLQQGKLTLQLAPFDLRALIDEIISLFATLTGDRRLEMLAIIYNDVPDRVIGDRLRIQQVLTNLLSNAVKFTPEGEILVRIMLDDGPADDGEVALRFKVQDTGIGISPEAQGQIFTPFSQADASTERRFGGTGLGLSICKQLVQGMGGEIGVLSQPDRGAEFWFRLALPIANANGSCTRGKLKGVRALVVDEHPLSRTALLCRLEYLGVTVVTRTAEAIIGDHPFPCEDISLLSLSWKDAMKDRLSAEAQDCIVGLKRRCRRQPLVAQVKTIDAALVEGLTQLGVNDCYLKPMGNETLLQVIGQLLSLPQNAARPEEMPLEPAPAGSIEGQKVLIVDDNPINLRLASVVIHSLGGIVIEATSGAEAIKLAGLRRFDFILMDAHMPDISGMEATQQIRAMETEGRHTPILALTADTLAEHHRRFLDAGMDGVLLKPFHEEDLLEAMCRLDPRHQERRVRPRPEAGLREDELPARDRKQALLAAAGLEAEADALFLEMLTGLGGYREILAHHLSAQDWNALSEVAHKLRGSAMVCGAPALEQVLGRLEDCARGQEVSRLGALISGLDREIDRLRQCAEASSSENS